MTMKFPYLSQWDNAVCKVSITDTKPSENGDFPTLSVYEGGCNLSEKSRTIRSKDGQYVRLSATLHIKGDIAPDMADFSGTALVSGVLRRIESVDRPRNPDGTIHHTRLGLI
jgi:hypothetical protein